MTNGSGLADAGGLYGDGTGVPLVEFRPYRDVVQEVSVMRTRLIIAIVLAVLFAACGDDDGLTSTSTTGGATSTSAGSSSTTEGVTTTTGPGGSSGWARIPHDDAVFGVVDPSWMWAVIYGATAAGPGVVAVGDRFPSVDYSDRPGVWTSPDGVAWAVVPHDEAVFGGVMSGYVEAVAAGPLGLVAVGTEYRGDDYDAVVFTSPDGRAWTRVPDPGGVFGGSGWQAMHAVTAGGPGWAAVGYDDSGEDRNAAVWTSPDGVTWTRVPHDESLFGGVNDQEIFGVVAAGRGLVAVGNDDEAPAAWVSADGVTWEKVPTDRFSSDPDYENVDKVMRAVAATPGLGLVAVGYLEWYSEATDTEDADAAVWVSEDGLSWVLVSEDAAMFGGPDDQKMAAVTAGGPGFVAVGWDRSGGDANAAVWDSPDGTNWTRVPDAAVFTGAGDQEMYGVGVGASRVVAVGRDGVNAAVWVSPPPG